MIFSSLLFLFIFLPAVLALYFLAPRGLRNLILFVASLVFYAWGEPVYVVLMIFSTVLDYTCGLCIARYRRLARPVAARVWLLVSMAGNLGLLGFFKYANFFVDNLNHIPGVALSLPAVALPIGISFYTFQTMSYTIDVYRGQVEAQRNIISFGAYVALFPQLIAGPIVQYKTIAQQLMHRRENFDQFSYGIVRFMSGLGKKVLLANNIGYLWGLVSAGDPAQLPVLTAWLGILAYTFQIYFDFSGYSDMAIGLGNMFGFRFLENFNYPYMSKSITEFWRRWHISLGTWFREYVYIPLGGNRRGLGLQLRNICVVWLLTGLWHGASWNFVVWGVYFGVWLVLEKLFLLRWLEKAPAFVGHLYTMLLVTVSWVIFYFDSSLGGMTKAARYLQTMFGMGAAGFADTQSIYYLLNYILLFLVLIFACTDLPSKLSRRFLEHARPWVGTLVQNVCLSGVFLLSVAYLVNSSYNPFLYLRF